MTRSVLTMFSESCSDLCKERNAFPPIESDEKLKNL